MGKQNVENFFFRRWIDKEKYIRSVKNFKNNNTCKN
jgi:hypothetical protein